MLALEKFGKQFPGFEREVHGIEIGADGEYWMRSVIESSAPAPAEKKAASPARNTKRRTKKPKPIGPIQLGLKHDFHEQWVRELQIPRLRSG